MLKTTVLQWHHYYELRRFTIPFVNNSTYVSHTLVIFISYSKKKLWHAKNFSTSFYSFILAYSTTNICKFSVESRWQRMQLRMRKRKQKKTNWCTFYASLSIPNDISFIHWFPLRFFCVAYQTLWTQNFYFVCCMNVISLDHLYLVVPTISATYIWKCVILILNMYGGNSVLAYDMETLPFIFILPPPLLFSPSFGSIGSFSSAPSFSVNVCKSCNCLAFELLHNIFRSFFLPYWSLLVTISWEC